MCRNAMSCGSGSPSGREGWRRMGLCARHQRVLPVSCSLGSPGSGGGCTGRPRVPAALCSCGVHSSPCDSSGSGELCWAPCVPLPQSPGNWDPFPSGVRDCSESCRLFVPVLLLLAGGRFRCLFFGSFCLEGSAVPCFGDGVFLCVIRALRCCWV